MPGSKRTRVQSKKKKRRFLMTSNKCWLMADHLVPLYSHLVDRYSNQLLEDPFCCEIIRVKQEPEDVLLESLPSVDEHNSSNHFKEVIRCFILLFSHLEFALEESKQWLRYCKTKQTCFFKRF